MGAIMTTGYDALDNYLIGWRDGFAQALADVELIIDSHTTNREESENS